MNHTSLLQQFKELPVPVNYYNGKGKRSFSLPLNILFFYRDRFEKQTLDPETNFHYRHVLIFNCGSPIGIMIDGSLIELPSDCFTLLLPYQYHRFINDGQTGISLLFVTFEMEENLPLLPLRNLASPTPAGILDLLEEILELNKRQEEEELPFHMAALLSRLLQSCSELIDYPKRNEPSQSKLVSEICRRLYENHGLNIEQLAREMSYSEGYLRNVFKKSLGITLGRYILESRLTEAMKYLSASEKSISEIAGLCGYDSIYSLSRSFRTHMGISPSTYRKERIKEKITS